MKRTGFLTLLLVLFCTLNLWAAPIIRHYPGEEPGEARCRVTKQNYQLFNSVLKADFRLEDESIVLKQFVNKHDHSKISVTDAVLFSVKMADGKVYTNHDFKVEGEVETVKLQPTDSLPRASLRSAGYLLKAQLKAEGAPFGVQWSAELRDGSNYVRQALDIEAHQKVKISEVTFFDMPLKGAEYQGSVLGSVISWEHMFFGMEHPIAHSKALSGRTIGGLTLDEKDVTNLIDGTGSYFVGVEHFNNSTGYELTEIALKKDGEAIATCKHVLNGEGGNNIYPLPVIDYDKDSKYTVAIQLEQPKNAWGTLYLYKKVKDVVNFYVSRNDELQEGQHISESSIMGVTPKEQLRRGFQYYVDRERARPYKQFLHYNSWWDISFLNENNSEQLIDCMHNWYDKFIKPYDIQFDSFVFDDGWDDVNHIWYFNKKNFPEGFAPQAKLCKEMNTGIGVWISPFGGYAPKHDMRVATAKREGLECNARGMSLSGKNYYNRFLERSLDMMTNYKVNHFKYDGFGGSDPEYLPDMEGGMRLISTLRKQNPDIFINITVGSWPSPFWLRYVDCTWRGSGDMFHGGEGDPTHQMMTYRDGTLHNNIVNRSPLYTLNSIMTCGIVYGKIGDSQKVSDNLQAFKDMTRSYFASGSALQELYVAHSRMDKAKWDALAEGAKWSREHESVLVDSHWVGGSPFNLEVYGWASWNGEAGVLCLRNPSKEEKTFELDLSKVMELQDSEEGNFEMKSPWKEDASKPVVKVNSEMKKTIKLRPYEVLVWDVVRK